MATGAVTVAWRKRRNKEGKQRIDWLTDNLIAVLLLLLHTWQQQMVHGGAAMEMSKSNRSISSFAAVSFTPIGFLFFFVWVWVIAALSCSQLTEQTNSRVKQTTPLSIYFFPGQILSPPHLHFTREPPNELRFSNSSGASIECEAEGNTGPVCI